MELPNLKIPLNAEFHRHDKHLYDIVLTIGPLVGIAIRSKRLTIPSGGGAETVLKSASRGR